MKYRDYAFPLMAVLIWSGNTVVNKLAAGAIAPGAMAFYRWLLAGMLTTPFLLPATWRNRREIGAHLPRLAALSALGMVLYQSLAYFAAESTSASNMGMITALIPLMTMLLSIAVLGETPTIGMVAGASTSLAGMVYLIGQGHPASLLRHGIGTGDLLMLIATLSYAAYGVLIKRWNLPVLASQSLYAQIWIGVVLLCPLYLLAPASPITSANLPLILYAGILASMVAPFVWMQGLSRLGANRTSIFMNLLPVFTVLIAVSVLGETLHAFDLIGGAMVMTGVLLAQMFKQPLRRSRPLLKAI